MKRRKINLVLFIVPESKQQNSGKQENNCLAIFTDFCTQGPKLSDDLLTEVETVIPLGKADNENSKTRPKKSGFGDKLIEKKQPVKDVGLTINKTHLGVTMPNTESAKH